MCTRRFAPAMRRVLLASGLLLWCISPGFAVEHTEPSRLANLLGGGDRDGFAQALQPREFAFPADHGPHPEFRNEWWYVTGNLDGADGERFGFELTIFRFALAPALPDSVSAWRTNQVYIAHFALTDAERGAFHVAERYSRGALGLAGAEAAPFRVWLDDWSIAADGNSWRLRAGDDAIELDVTLESMRPPVLNGVDGLSQKSAEPGNASYYYSLTRLRTEGRLSIDGRDYAVSGLSWLDREWSTSALGARQAGWDWFALQLDDGSELMFYALRGADGRIDEHSAGTFVGADGNVSYLARDDMQIDVTDHWQSPRGGRYPAGWNLRSAKLGIDLAIEPVMADQELITLVRYWEGAVDVRGTRAGATVDGRGYVELTGYAD